MRAFFVLALLLHATVAFAYDGKANRYTVTIDDAVRTARVEADIWMPSNILAMFAVLPTQELPNGQADLVHDLKASDAKGRALTVKNLGEGDFELGGTGRVTLSYTVALEHDRYHWPAGLEEVAFRNGLSLVRTDERDEWFNEGVTDYLTVATQAQTGVIDERQLFWRLENVARRYLIARYAQNLWMTVREAGANKQPTAS